MTRKTEYCGFTLEPIIHQGSGRICDVKGCHDFKGPYTVKDGVSLCPKHELDAQAYMNAQYGYAPTPAPATPSNAPRLATQLQAVRDLMSDGQWRTLEQVREQLGKRGIPATTPGVSARIRDLRKPQFGGYNVARQQITRGVYQYRVAA